MNKTDLPIGFGIALAQNETAMKQFESLSSTQKEAVINKTRKPLSLSCQKIIY